MFLIEMECKHCGAPMGCIQTTPARFAAMPAQDTGVPSNHHEHELDGIRLQDVEGCKPRFIAYSDCRSSY